MIILIIDNYPLAVRSLSIIQLSSFQTLLCRGVLQGNSSNGNWLNWNMWAYDKYENIFKVRKLIRSEMQSTVLAPRWCLRRSMFRSQKPEAAILSQFCDSFKFFFRVTVWIIGANQPSFVPPLWSLSHQPSETCAFHHRDCLIWASELWSSHGDGLDRRGRENSLFWNVGVLPASHRYLRRRPFFN